MTASHEGIAADHARFEALVATAVRQLERGRLDAAAAWAQTAGQFAWTNHAGRFASPELEAVLAQLAARCPPPGRRGTKMSGSAGHLRPSTAQGGGGPRGVLHVLTQAYQTGGSTREVACWAELDAGRRHRVCVTRQGPTPPPAFLSTAGAGVEVLRLDTARGGLMARAAALRALARDADVVVLHVHPYDVVPVIAFAGQEHAPPVILVNHADHVFWVGTGVADVVFHMRESGRELAERRRGVAPERSFVMARPLMPHDRVLPREEAKRRLGLDPETVVLATAADGTKYRPVGPDSFLGLVLAVLERHPEAVLLAAGPSSEGAWEEAAARTGGRVRALGRLPDVTLLHEAADVYLDSFPFSSLTSLLEAGSVGAPAITYRGHPADCGVLGAEVPGVDELLQSPGDPEAFAGVLSRAIADAAWRRELGERTEAAIRATHTGEGWRAAAAELYARAAAAPRPVVAGRAAQAEERLDALVREVMAQTGYAQGVPGALRANLGLLPPADRAAAALRLAREGQAPGARDVVPEWLRPAVAAARRRVRGRAPAQTVQAEAGAAGSR